MSATTPSTAAANPTPPCVAVPPDDGHRWFREQVAPHGPLLHNYLKGKFPAVRDVDDVVQESYLRIWKARSAHQIASAKAFLFRIARHVAIDLVRRAHASPIDEGRVLDDLPVLDVRPDAADALVAQDIFQLLADAIASLPRGSREVFILHKLEGLSHRETAAKLNLSERTVEKYSARGLKRCEDYLRAHGIDDALN